jgi:hypothetical protein
MKGLVLFSLVTLFFGFLAACVIQKILHDVFRFRSEWNTTLIACTMTALVCELALVVSFACYDNEGMGYFFKAIGTTGAIAMIAGTISCRLIIRSGSGRHLPAIGAAILATVLSIPPVFIGMVIHLFGDSE